MTKRFTFYVQMMLIVLAGFLTVEAQARTTDEPLVNLRANRVPITEVLAQLEKQTDVIFSYESSQLEKFPAISIQAFLPCTLTGLLLGLFPRHILVVSLLQIIVRHD